MAAEDFDAMARGAAELMPLIKSREWSRIAEIATEIRSALASASGAWPDLLTPLEKDKLGVASKAIESLIETTPGEDGADGVEKTQGMMAQCNFVINVVGEIAGRLKYLEEG